MLSSRQLGIVENVTVVWLDLNISELNDSISQLRRSVLHSVQTFDEPDQCVDFLSEMQYDKVFFIISDSLASIIVHLVHETRQLHHIYILADKTFDHEEHWFKEWRKIKGLFTDIASVSSILIQNIRRWEDNAGSISIIPRTVDANLNELDSSFKCTLNCSKKCFLR